MITGYSFNLSSPITNHATTDIDDTDDKDQGKWGLAGLLALMGLILFLVMNEMEI